MSNLTVKRDGGTLAPPRHEWDPFAWARRMLSMEPFGDVHLPAPFEGGSFAPAFEVKETNDAYEFRADVPGVKEKDLEITCTGDRLTIRGTRESDREDKGETYYARERSYGSFMRSFVLPSAVDPSHVRADLKDGVLMIAVPKTEQVKPRQIPIGGAAKKS